MKQKLDQQRKHLNELEKHMYVITRLFSVTVSEDMMADRYGDVVRMSPRDKGASNIEHLRRSGWRGECVQVSGYMTATCTTTVKDRD